MNISNLLGIKVSLIEFPRPCYACQKDWVQHYLKHQLEDQVDELTLSPPTKATIERFI
jgi:hypothetical protein